MTLEDLEELVKASHWDILVWNKTKPEVYKIVSKSAPGEAFEIGLESINGCERIQVKWENSEDFGLVKDLPPASYAALIYALGSVKSLEERLKGF